ncbi:MAG TPA: hypothetical protein VKW08_28235 [Xanthobacteraceae bacterium]|jgi:hypothetical protein|nr:hypothetical protein [Xanthobacteraceae bacterium]
MIGDKNTRGDARSFERRRQFNQKRGRSKAAANQAPVTLPKRPIDNPSLPING